MTNKYKFDASIPAGGYRCNKDNAGLVLMHITEQTTYVKLLMDRWDFYLAIDALAKSYNAEVRIDYYEESKKAKKCVAVELTPAILDNIVELTGDGGIMDVKSDEINNHIIVMDGVTTTIELKKEERTFKAESNNLDSIEENGTFLARGEKFQTKIHLIFKRIRKVLDDYHSGLDKN